MARPVDQHLERSARAAPRFSRPRPCARSNSLQPSDLVRLARLGELQQLRRLRVHLFGLGVGERRERFDGHHRLVPLPDAVHETVDQDGAVHLAVDRDDAFAMLVGDDTGAVGVAEQQVVEGRQELVAENSFQTVGLSCSGANVWSLLCPGAQLIGVSY